MATFLVPRRVLDPVEWDHGTVVGSSHIEACKHLGLVAVQVCGVSQLTRDTDEERRQSYSMMRRRLAGGWHHVVMSK